MSPDTFDRPSSASRFIFPEGRAGELGHVVNESLLGVKRAWLYKHKHGPTVRADEGHRFDLALVIVAAIASISPEPPVQWQEAAGRIPATLRLELTRQDDEFIKNLAKVAQLLAQPEADLSDGDFAVLDRFASLVAQTAITTADTFPSS